MRVTSAVWSRLLFARSWCYSALGPVLGEVPVRRDLESLPLTIRVAVKASLVGIVVAVVLLGHLTSTQMAFYVVMAGGLAVYVLARGEELVAALLDYLTSRMILWRWAFVAWAVLSLLWTSRGHLSVDRAITLLEIQVVGLILFDAAKNLGATRLILNTVFVSIAFAAAHAMLTEDPTVVQRLSGLFASPNTLGMYCVLALAIFAAGFAERARKGALALIYVSALVLLVGVLGSASQKGVVGFILVTALGLVIRPSRRRVSTLFGIMTGTGLVLFATFEPVRRLWWNAVHRFAETVAMFGTSASVNESVMERARFIERGLALISESPVFGAGLDTFRWLSDEGTYAHNNFIEVGVALGLVGILLYYGLHVSILRAALSRRRVDDYVWRFIMISVPTTLILDVAVVSYLFKLSTLMLIVSAAWLERGAGADALALGRAGGADGLAGGADGRASAAPGPERAPAAGGG